MNRIKSILVSICFSAFIGSISVFGATPPIEPRGDGEGAVGHFTNQWGAAHFVIYESGGSTNYGTTTNWVFVFNDGTKIYMDRNIKSERMTNALSGMAGTNFSWSGTDFNLDGAAQDSDDLADSAIQDNDTGLTLSGNFTSTGTLDSYEGGDFALTNDTRELNFSGTITVSYADIGIPYSTHSESNLVTDSTILTADSWVKALYSTSDILLTNTTIIAAGRSGQQVQFRNVGGYDIILSAKTNNGASLFLNGRINRTIAPNNMMSLTWCNIQGGWVLQSDPTSEISPSASVQPVRNVSGSSIPALSVVRISGYNSGLDRVTIELTSNTNPVSDKAIGVTPDPIPNNRNGIVVTFGMIEGKDTSAWSILDELHVGLVQGSLTNGIPPGTNQFRQFMATVTRSGVGNGSIFVAGALRANAVPSLIEDSTWQGRVIGELYVDSLISRDDEASAIAVSATNYTDGAMNGLLSNVPTYGFQLMIDSSDWFNWGTGHGSTASNSIVVTRYTNNVPTATNNINSGWGWYSSDPYIQDKYSYARLKVPDDAVGWGNTALIIRVRSTAIGVATNYVDFLMDDGINVFVTNNLRSTTANVWNEYVILKSLLPNAMTNLVTYGYNDGGGIVRKKFFSLRSNSFSSKSQIISFLEVLCDWVK